MIARAARRCLVHVVLQIAPVAQVVRRLRRVGRHHLALPAVLQLVLRQLDHAQHHLALAQRAQAPDTAHRQLRLQRQVQLLALVRLQRLLPAAQLLVQLVLHLRHIAVVLLAVAQHAHRRVRQVQLVVDLDQLLDARVGRGLVLHLLVVQRLRVGVAADRQVAQNPDVQRQHIVLAHLKHHVLVVLHELAQRQQLHHDLRRHLRRLERLLEAPHQVRAVRGAQLVPHGGERRVEQHAGERVDRLRQRVAGTAERDLATP